MVAVDLGFCPRCGGHLEPCEGGRSHRSCCPVCGFYVYHNPAPVVVATVVDANHALFVKRAKAPEKGCWAMPGGYMEIDEAPDDGAARELAEETGLEADPSDMTFIGTAYEPLGENRGVVDIMFAVPRDLTTGDPVAGDDAAEVRYWTREEIAADPPELRAGDVTPILRAIDTLGTAAETPLW